MVDIFRKPRPFRYSIFVFAFGNVSLLSNCLGKKHMNEFTTEDYKKFKQEQGHKIHGWFLFGKPALSINDVDLIKQIQVIPLSYYNSSKILFRSKTSTTLWTGMRPTLEEVLTKEET